MKWLEEVPDLVVICEVGEMVVDLAISGMIMTREMVEGVAVVGRYRSGAVGVAGVVVGRLGMGVVVMARDGLG